MRELEWIANARADLREAARLLQTAAVGDPQVPWTRVDSDRHLAKMVGEIAARHCYGVEREIERFIDGAAQKMPLDWRLTREMLPDDYGAMLYQFSFMNLKVEDEETPLFGLLWGKAPQGAILFSYSLTHYSLVGMFSWDFSETIREASERISGRITTDGTSFHVVEFLKTFAATCLFLQQRILDPVWAVPDRAQRRRQEHGDADYSNLRVITLRRRQAMDAPEGEGNHIDYRWRFVVSGHWRMQWYPSLQQHIPVWIMPYVKGPDDKPLKPPSERVFQVVR